MKSNPRIARGDAELLCGPGRRQPVEINHPKQLTVHRWEPAHHRFDALADLRIELGRKHRIVRHRSLAFERLFRSRTTPVVIDHRVAQRPVEELHRPVLVERRWGRLRHPEPDLLENVLRCFTALDPPLEKAAEQVVAVDQRALNLRIHLIPTQSVTARPSAPNARVNTALRCLAVTGLMLGACATPTRSVPAALDPANPDAEETVGAALTPLVDPAPTVDATSDDGGAKLGAHAGHNMAAMTKDPNDPHAGHDMAAMAKDPADPHAGHDMPAMKKDAGHDMAAMAMPAEKPGEEEHLMGVVTRVEPGALTVILEKGSSAIIQVDGKTTYERGEAKTSSKGIKPGERIVVYAVPRGGKWLARVVKLAAAGPKEHVMGNPESKPSAPAQQFTCPMHPEVRSATPGKCPKCGMKLQPVTSP